jgi:1-acyl-sn-glycerol-3-phosphate acyltransferase
LLYWHRYRGLGLAACACLAAFIAGFVAAASGEWHSATSMVATSCLGFAFIRFALFRFALFLSYPLRDTDQAAWSLLFLVLGFFALYAGASIGDRTVKGWFPPPHQFLWLPACAALLSLLSLLFLFRPVFELACEPILWIMYRIRPAGPGIAAMPVRGPCLVVANHACWFDPFFLAKVMPRPITAMMTSRFYDKPVLRWLFKYILRAIRVPEGQLRRGEVPEEIREAIAALDRGECVAIFPEGYLRRSEDKPLKRFGRGVWQILSARPETPVFTCWIEGNWGSFCSYFNGKPTKNKRPDFRRSIGVAVAAPIVLDAATLANHLSTRIFLMNRVIEARQLLGLAQLPPFELPHEEKEGLAVE